MGAGIIFPAKSSGAVTLYLPLIILIIDLSSTKGNKEVNTHAGRLDFHCVFNLEKANN